ncbi:uncharacterized protein [Antedon mediterranea]
MKYYVMWVICVCSSSNLVAAQTGFGSCSKTPSHPDNGVILYSPGSPGNLPNLMHGTRAQYLCNVGYTNIGPQLVIYCYNGTWLGLDNDEPSMCVKKHNNDCKSPEGNSRRNYLIQTGSFRSAVKYKCVPGYILHPKNRTVSNCINGGWTQLAPHCIDPSIILASPTPDDKDEKDNSSSGSLSPGVVVGIVVAVLLILIFGILIYRTRFRFYKRNSNFV